MNEFRPIHISGYLREEHDFYPTPSLGHRRAAEACAPARTGVGAVLWRWRRSRRVIGEQGYDVVATDLADHGFGRAGVDFFACQAFPGRLLCAGDQSAVWRWRDRSDVRRMRRQACCGSFGTRWR